MAELLISCPTINPYAHNSQNLTPLNLIEYRMNAINYFPQLHEMHENTEKIRQLLLNKVTWLTYLKHYLSLTPHYLYKANKSVRFFNITMLVAGIGICMMLKRFSSLSN